MGLHNFHDLLERGTCHSTQRIANTPEGWTAVIAKAAPSGAGYAPGCMFVNSVSGLVYRNAGSKASVSWTALTSGNTGVLDQTGTWDAGTFDLAWSVTSQTTAGTITIPDMNLAGGSTAFVFTTATQTLTNKTLTAPTITEATLGVKDSVAADYQVSIVSTTTAISANRTLTLDMRNASRTLDLAGNLTLAAGFTTAGANALTLTTSGETNVTLPTTGTLATLAGSESLSNKTLVDANCTIVDNVDATKAIAFQASGITTGTTRTLTVLDYSGSIPAYAGAGAQGEILYFSGTAWTRLGVGVAGQALLTNGAAQNPQWGYPAVGTASVLANSCKLDDPGALDATLAFTQQTVASPALTVPDFAGVSDTFAFVTLAQTLANKTLTAPILNKATINIPDTDASHALTLKWNANMAANQTLNFLTGAADRTITLGGNLTTATDAITLTATGGGSSVTLPASGTVATLAGSEALTNKTLTTADINGGTADSLTSLSVRSSGAAFDMKIACDTVLTADHTVTFTTPDADMTLTLPTTGTLATLAGVEELTNKTLTSPAINTPNVDGGTVDSLTSLSVRSTGAAFDMFIACSTVLTGDRTLTLNIPAGSDATLTVPGGGTLVCTTTTQTLTNKTINCATAGTVLSNINAEELEPAGTDAYSVPFVIKRVVTDEATDTIFNAAAPFKFRILDTWSVATSATGGTWKLNNGIAGGGNDITDTVTVAASDKDIDRAGTIDDLYHVIAAGGSLSVVTDGAVDIILYILCVRES